MAPSAQKTGGINTKSGPPRVAVIGAGIAGLRCADVLLSEGFQVTVIEGRDRVGGRMHQEQLSNGHLVDVGPNWIHGTKNNPILDIVRQTNTIVANLDEGSSLVDESGNMLNEEAKGKLESILWSIIEEAFEHSDKKSREIHKAESLFDFFQQKVKEKIPDSEPDFEETRRRVLHMSELWGAFVGSPIQRQSLKFFWLEEFIEGDNLFCAETYKKVLDLIAKPALSEAQMKLSTTAQKISYRQDAEEGVKIDTDDGQTLSFDEVVVTAPLGWLKHNLEAFDPALPQRLVQAIQAIGYGCLEKVYISFPEAFWHTRDDHGINFEGFVHFPAPNYAPDLNPKRWNQEAVELASCPSATSHPTLLFYTFGEQSQHMTGKLDGLSTQAEKERFIFDFFHPYYSRLPNYSVSSEGCKPTCFLATRWARDSLAGYGSYSNFQVGLESGDKDIETMREGLPEQGLWLAGEHTSPFIGLGTATGAYWSGESVATRIVEAYKLKK